ncbi:MAG: hypothetical protein AOA66_0164 [Candidatus Bathyarchaeota archaeon BA2]|nr:MAG: hypothetical protein AOA66_0164 [Candidatus Bathyarchaeota archaeon BA2]
MGKIREVPSFLLTDVSGSSDDRNRLIIDLQLLALWQYVHGNRPFSREQAIELQKELRDVQKKRQEQEREEMMKRLTETQKQINEAGAEIIRSRLYGLIDGVEVHKWSKKVRYIKKTREGVKWSVKTTLNELCDWLLNGVQQYFDCNPLRDVRGFTKEIYDKFNGYAFPRLITNANGEDHTFQVKLLWRV